MAGRPLLWQALYTRRIAQTPGTATTAGISTSSSQSHPVQADPVAQVVLGDPVDRAVVEVEVSDLADVNLSQ